MKKIIIIILLMFSTTKGQNKNFPSYEKVVTQFLNTYSIKNICEDPIINFEKKESGWYVTVSNYNNEILKKEHYWDNKQKKYNNVYFEKLNKNEKNDLEINKLLNNTGAWYYDNMILYGYKGVYWDIIQKFKDNPNPNDKTLFSLGVAYSNYARSLLHSDGEYPDQQFNLPEGRNSMTEKQLKKFRHYSFLSKRNFKELKKRNPSFETFIGPIQIKIANDYVANYVDIKMYQNETEAKKEIIDGLYPKNWISSAKNYLTTCQPNAILFTMGDNDTYPLLYVQAQYGFRTDITIINLSLLNLSRYINTLREKTKKHPDPFNMEKRLYKQGNIDVAYFLNDPIEGLFKSKADYEYATQIINLNGHKSWSLNEFNNWIASEKTYTNLQYPVGCKDDCLKLKYFPIKSIIVDINKKAFLKNNTFMLNEQALFEDYMIIDFEKNYANYLTKSSLMVLDLLEKNNWERPIYFAITIGNPSANPGSFLYLNEYLQLEGMVYQLVPIKSSANENGRVNSDLLYNNIINKIDWKKIRPTKSKTELRIYANYKNILNRVASKLIEEGRLDKAESVIKKRLNVFPIKFFPLDIYDLPFLENYFKVISKKETLGHIPQPGLNKKNLTKMIDNLIERYKSELNSPSGTKKEKEMAKSSLDALYLLKNKTQK